LLQQGVRDSQILNSITFALTFLDAGTVKAPDDAVRTGGGIRVRGQREKSV